MKNLSEVLSLDNRYKTFTSDFNNDYNKDQEYSRPNVTPLTKSDDSFHFNIVSIEMIDPNSVSNDVKPDGQPPIDSEKQTNQSEIEQSIEKPSPIITFTEKPSIFAGLVWAEQTLRLHQDAIDSHPDDSAPHTALLPEKLYVERV